MKKGRLGNLYITQNLFPLEGKSFSRTFVPMTWKRQDESNVSMNGNCVWADGTNIYYSDVNKNLYYVLNKETKTWEVKTWNGTYTTLYPMYMWTDGDDIYNTREGSCFVLNRETDTWETKTMSYYDYALEYEFNGFNVWSDGTNIYYSHGSYQCVFDKETDTWEEKTWNGFSTIYGRYVWTDGTNIYYSNGSEQYVLNKETDTWEVKTWNGFSEFIGEYIWSDGTNIYYSNVSEQYVLNSDAWRTIEWNGINVEDVTSGSIWTDGENIYLGVNPSEFYILAHTTTKFYSRVNGEWVEMPVPPVGDTCCDDLVSLIAGSITEFSNEDVTSVRAYAFGYCDALISVDLPNVTDLGEGAFYDCDVLTSVNIPNATNIGNWPFQNCTSLMCLDLPSATSLGEWAFYNCGNLEALILRSESVVTLANSNAFDSASRCIIYVPSALIEEYKAASGWSDIANSKFKSLEDYTLDGTITGKFDWENRFKTS